MPTATRPRRRDALLLAVMATVALGLFALAPPITHHGEAREGLVVQDVVAHRHWILPRRNGELPSKPPLFHWVAAVATDLLGAGDASLRVPSVAAAVVVLLAVQALGSAIGGRVTGWLAAAMLLGTAPFVAAAVEARVDMVFAAAITLALVAFRFWDVGRRPAARVAVYASLAAAVLTKGPAGLVLPLVAIVAFLACERRLATLRALFDWRLALAVVVVDAGWYALACADGGAAFVHLQIVHENLERALGGATYGRSGRHGVLRLAWSLVAGFLPWSLVLPAALVAAARGRRSDADARFLHAWWLAVFAVFALAVGKRAVYLLPAAPAVVLLAARALVTRLAGGGAAASRLDRMPIPAWLRSRTDRPRLATVAALVVLFAFGAMLTVQGTRVRRAERGSLVAFAAAVRNAVPADGTLVAAADLGRDETLVLAYRLAQALPREATRGDGAPYALVPASDVPSRTAEGWRLLAESHRRRGANVALVAHPAASCRTPQGVAGCGAVAGAIPGNAVSTKVAVPPDR